MVNFQINRALSVLLFGNDAFSTIVLDALHLNSLNRCKHSYQRIIDKVEIICSGLESSKKSRSILEYARSNDLAIHNYSDYNCDNASNRCFHNLRNRFEIGVVVSFGQLLSKEWIDLFARGIINVHPSLLPRWRGPSPIQFALLHGDNKTGVTITDIFPDRYDKGHILMQEEIKINDRETYVQLHGRLADLGSNLLLRALLDLSNLHGNSRKQNEKDVTYASKINQNMSWINWSEHSCEMIYRMWKALSHQTGLRTIWNDAVVKLIDFCYFEKSKVDLNDMAGYTNYWYGFVKYNEDLDAIVVKCKDGLVAFKKVQFTCRKAITALDFRNGYLTRTEETKRYFSMAQKLN